MFDGGLTIAQTHDQLIRPAGPEDAERIVEICRGLPPWSSKGVADLLRDAPRRGHAFGSMGWIIGDGKACLVARFLGEVVEILLLASLASERRCGHATALMARLDEEACSRNVYQVMLEVAIGNEAARSLYTRLGFTVFARRRGYYGGEDAVLMQRSLV